MVLISRSQSNLAPDEASDFGVIEPVTARFDNYSIMQFMSALSSAIVDTRQ